ncbi:MAG: glycosyl hydrolase, repeat-containing protein [Frankiales bacterium]|nr:glycosyl hydrolase, repeat-containing protein [Frankiales bacterium]
MRAVPLLVAALLLAGCTAQHDAAVPRPDPVVPSTGPASAPASASASAPPSPSAARTVAPFATGLPAGGPVPAGFSPLSFSFVSPRTGWVLGDAPCDDPACASLLLTRDGGRTWRGVPAPEHPTTSAVATASTVRAVRFASLRDGFAFDSVLSATHDGGATWHDVPLPGRVQALETAAGRVHVVVAVCSAAGCRSALYTGASSSDDLRPVPGVDLPGDAGAGLAVHGRHVYVLRPGTDDGRTDPALYAGQDGAHYALRRTPCTGEYRFDAAVAASDDTDLVLVCGSDVGAGMQRKHVYTSVDAGQHWTAAGDPPPVSGTLLAATRKGTFLGNTRTGVDVTRDGRTWTHAVGDDATTQVGFVTDDLGFFLQDALQVTRDAGRTWSRVRFSR